MRYPASALQGVRHEPDASGIAFGPAAPIRRSSLVGRFGALARSLRNLCLRVLLPPKTRRLRVNETVSLGDKRFVSIVEVDGVDYLIGGGTASVALLTRLGPATAEPFQQAINEAWRATQTA